MAKNCGTCKYQFSCMFPICREETGWKYWTPSKQYLIDSSHGQYNIDYIGCGCGSMSEDIHKKLCIELNKLYKAKDADYGSSYKKTRIKYPMSVLIRLNDKLNRLETLFNNDAKVADESIDDTLMDMAGYCLLELTERRLDGNKE